MTRSVKMLMLIALGLTPVTMLLADSDWRSLHGDVQAGKLVSLGSVLDWLDRHYIGSVIEVELERDDGRALYEIEMIGPQGQLVEFEFDAVNGELISIEGVGIQGMTRP